MMSFSSVIHLIHELARQEVARSGGAFSGSYLGMRIPPSWIRGEVLRLRCECNNVISDTVKGAAHCPSCDKLMLATFPEDRPGPLEHILGMP